MFDKAYLDQLIINQIEENPELEYKAALALQKDDKKVMEITKDVSAFANSNGGILIYGISEDQNGKRIPGKIDPVNRKVISKEWLEQILNAKIRPRIHGLTIHVVTILEDQAVYILEIPKGETAHQAEDKRYYRRHNFMVEPLYDHEIRDIMGRQKNADIAIDFEISRKGNHVSGTNGQQQLNDDIPYNYYLDIYAHNIGKIYAKYVNIAVVLPKRCVQGSGYNQSNRDIQEFRIDNTVRDLVEPNAQYYYRGPIAKPKQYGSARYEPILPGVRTKLKSIHIHEYSRDAGNGLSWTIYADNAEPKSGEMEFGQINYS